MAKKVRFFSRYSDASNLWSWKSEIKYPPKSQEIGYGEFVGLSIVTIDGAVYPAVVVIEETTKSFIVIPLETDDVCWEVEVIEEA